MARRGIPKGPVLWFLREWMRTQNVQKQTDMMDRTGWSKAKMSQLYNGMQDFNSEILQEAALALNIRPYELLMHPEEAMALRQMHANALTIAADRHAVFLSEPAEASQEPQRKAG